MQDFDITASSLGSQIQAEKPTVLIIGNLDGIHKGHAALIASARQLADQYNGTLGAVSFFPHPRRIFQPDASPFLLASPEKKIALLQEHGVDYLYNLCFDRQLANMTAIDFIKRCLVETIGCQHIVVGKDFHFGKNRLGNVEILKQAGKAYNFQIHPQILTSDKKQEIISSSRIRDAIRTGDIETANMLLNWNWGFAVNIQNTTEYNDDILCIEAACTDDDLIQPASGGYHGTMTSRNGKKSMRVFILHNTLNFVKLFCNKHRFATEWGTKKDIIISLQANLRISDICDDTLDWITDQDNEQDDS